MEKVRISSYLNKIICVLILICVILGNTIKLGDIRIAGVVVTLYRIGIPIISMFYIIKRIINKKWVQYFAHRMHRIYIIIFAIWILYGSILLFTSEYVVLHDGLKEIINLILGVMTIYCFTECCTTKDDVAFLIKTLKIITTVLCVIALQEMFFGVHFSTSKYQNIHSLHDLYEMVLVALTSGKIFPVTSIFYGVNDFAAFITIFAPLFFIDKNMIFRDKVLNSIMFTIIALLLALNDANVCLIALMITIIFMMFIKKINICSVGYFADVFFVQQYMSKWIYNGITYIEKYVKEKEIKKVPLMSGRLLMDAGGIDDVASVSEVLNAQMLTAEKGYGSLYSRYLLLLDGLDIFLKSHFLGTGPASFTTYLRINGHRSKYVNPHNWWIEILSQYGIIVFISYMGMLLYIFAKNVQCYFKNNNFIILQCLCMLVAYVIASIAPSSFLGYGYQWIIIALEIISIEIFHKEINKDD